jgi:hypothetical protein
MKFILINVKSNDVLMKVVIVRIHRKRIVMTTATRHFLYLTAARLVMNPKK